MNHKKMAVEFFPQSEPLAPLLLTPLMHSDILLACDAFIRMNRRTIAMMFVRLGQACTELSLWLDSPQCSGHPDTKACPPTPSHLFPFPPGREVGYG